MIKSTRKTSQEEKKEAFEKLVKTLGMELVGDPLLKVSCIISRILVTRSSITLPHRTKSWNFAKSSSHLVTKPHLRRINSGPTR